MNPSRDHYTAVDETSLDAALDIAMNHDRAVYDALSVALEVDLGLEGVTADEPLVNVVSGDYPQIVLLRDWP